MKSKKKSLNRLLMGNFKSIINPELTIEEVDGEFEQYKN